MKNRFVLILVLLVGLFSAPAIEAQKNLTLEDCFVKIGALVPSNLKQLNWIPGTENYYWIKKVDGADVLMSENAKKAGEKSLVTLAEFNAMLDKQDQAAATAFPLIHFTDATHFWFEYNFTLFHCDLTAKACTPLSSYDPEGENADVHASGRVAFTKVNELYASIPGKNNVQLTTGSADGIENGKSAHRNEFGIDKGTFWSPNGNLLAFYRVDETMVTTYPIMDLSSMPAGARMIRYPMAGAKSHHATVGVWDSRTGKTIFLKTGEPAEQYLTNITFSPDEKSIYIAVLNRDQNHLWLNQYDIATGSFVKTLFEETDAEYVEPKHGLYFLPTIPNEFLWMSQRDGYNHLYHYNTSGTLLGQLTKGNWVVTDFLGFDKEMKNIFVVTTNPNPTERHAWSVNLKTKEMKALTTGAGNHTVMLQPDGHYILDNHVGHDVKAREVKLADVSGKVLRTLFSSPNNIEGFSLGEVKIFALKAADGSDLWCRMVLPPGFDATKKYPVIDYVYGGPGVQMINDVWLGGSALWQHYAAQQGYIIFSMDNRGSANRGLAFEQAIFKNLGTVEIDDQLKGVEYLKSLPYVDADHMGVFGWSFGGFMTTSLMLRSPGTFQVGVAGGPVIDWRMYEIMYTERYMDTPQDNAAGYEGADLLTKVKNLKGKLMLIHGTSDDVVLWQHSLSFLQQAVTDGVQVDYFVYPGHQHNVFGKDRVHLYRKVLDYLMENI
jgi:dipeptidyl-peptidase 4